MAGVVRYKERWRAQLNIDGLRDSRIFETKPKAKRWVTERENELRELAGLAD